MFCFDLLLDFVILIFSSYFNFLFFLFRLKTVVKDISAYFLSTTSLLNFVNFNFANFISVFYIYFSALQVSVFVYWLSIL